MARKPMVTRTIITTKVVALMTDVVKCEVFNKEFVLPRTYKDSEKLLKAVKEIGDTDTEKVVHIVNKEEVETLYGMSEKNFIDNAVILDPKTRKPVDPSVEDLEADDEAEEN